MYYLLSGEFYVGELIAKEDIHEQYCLTDSGHGEDPTLELCSEAAKRGQYIYWDFQQVSCLGLKGKLSKYSMKGSGLVVICSALQK